MYCLAQREIERTHANRKTMPDIFSDPGYSTLSTSVLSTSNCGNPALRVSHPVADGQRLMKAYARRSSALRVRTGNA